MAVKITGAATAWKIKAASSVVTFIPTPIVTPHKAQRTSPQATTTAASLFDPIPANGIAIAFATRNFETNARADATTSPLPNRMGPDKRCQLNRSMQHHKDSNSPRRPHIWIYIELRTTLSGLPLARRKRLFQNRIPHHGLIGDRHPQHQTVLRSEIAVPVAFGRGEVFNELYVTGI
jgi:hypothetical protein